MSYYLDASVIVPTLVDEATSPAADAFLQRPTRTLAISDFAAAEVVSALSRLVRTGVLIFEDAVSRLDAFDSWRLGVPGCALQPSDHHAAYLLVRRFELRLRAPDALHLAICRRADHELVTLDRDLARAAAAIGVRSTTL